jgi:hypothetical protein
VGISPWGIATVVVEEGCCGCVVDVVLGVLSPWEVLVKVVVRKKGRECGDRVEGKRGRFVPSQLDPLGSSEIY